MKAWPVLGIVILQIILCLAHWFLYSTWIDFWLPLAPAVRLVLRVVLIALSASFIVAALLSFRYYNWLVRLIYRVAALWIGLFNFLIVAACLSWAIDFALRALIPGPAHLHARPFVVALLSVLAFAVSLYGVLNARIIRVRRVHIRLPRLPDSWRSRRALLISDVHLGNINTVRFACRLTEMSARLKPDILFIAGDLFDGSKADPERLAGPLLRLAPPLGTYFVLGNHEEFGGEAHYVAALAKAGIHVLNNERVIVDGLQIIGVPFGHSTYPIRLRNFLESLHLGEGPASILLNHVPHRLPIAEQAGVSLQLSGHTHGGQVFPFSWITRRAFGRYTYGLQQFGQMRVYTSSGAGTWGPPMRVGTHPEIVLLTFS